MIVVLGAGPLPIESARRHEAAGMRAWQFASGLAEAGVRCSVLLLRRGAESGAPARDLPFPVDSLSAAEIEEPAALRARLDRLRPSAVVGASTYPSYLAARSGSPAPLWIDLNGDPMAEARALASAGADERSILDAWWMLSWCLRRGDRFSAISRPHRLAVLGQLGAYGRQALDDSSLAVVIPEAHPVDVPAASSAIAVDRESIVLFSGSFNGWTDGDTFLRGFELALAEHPGLRCVVTGGPIAGVTELAWRRFLDARDALPQPIRARIEVLGWVDSNELEQIEARALCGVVAERPIVERELGGNNRSLRWMAKGIPVIMTGLSELGRESARAGAALLYRAGDPGSLAAALGSIAADRTAAQAVASRARSWLRENRSIGTTTRPLVAWAARPEPASDRLSGAAERLARRHAEMLRDIEHLQQRDG